MRRVRLWQVMLVAVAVELVGLVAASLTTFLTDASGAAAWLATPVAAVVAGGAKVLTDAMSRDDKAAAVAPPPPGYPPPGYPPYQGAVPQPARRGSPLAVALAALVLVVGVGGYAAAAGVR